MGKLWKKWGSKAFDKIFGPITEKSGRYKSKIKYCLFGEPVDAITGRVFSENEEFNFPGAIPLRFIRRYYSDMEDEQGDAPLGRGWHHNFDVYYRVDADGLITLRYQVRLIRGKGGQVLEEIQNGYSIKHSYDSSGLRLKRMSILGEDLTNAYNPLGELVETSSQLNSKLRWQASFGYDTLSREVF